MITIAAFAMALLQAPLPDIYQIDRAHAEVSFTVRLVGFNRVRGAFDRFEGHVTWDPRRPERGSVTFTIDAGSVDTGNEERDNHLRSADFFDVARFPQIRFRSTRVEPAAPGFVVIGDLTIRDVTREVRLPIELVSGDTTDPFGNRRVAFSSRLSINRRDFSVIGPAFWNNAISDRVDIELEIPGRIWTYTHLGFSPRSVGRHLTQQRDSVGLPAALRAARAAWARPDRDSVMSFSAFEIEKAAGRLWQAGQLADALAVLQLGAETLGQTPGRQGSWVLALRAHLEVVSGRRAAARASLDQALASDSLNTLALELRRLVP